MKVFCDLTRNDWHRVYLVRKIAHLYGMEFAQKLVMEARFNWVFPVEILRQVKKEGSPWRWPSAVSSQSVPMPGLGELATVGDWFGLAHLCAASL